MIDYATPHSAIGLNWYTVDPNLRFQMERFVAREDRDWAEKKLLAMGELVGGPIAGNAESTDKNGPTLVRWSREGEEINEVVHPASSLDSRRRLWKAGLICLPWSEEARRRGRPVPEPLMVGLLYLLSEAETGMGCALGMTGGVHRLVERYGDEATRDEFLPKLSTLEFDDAYTGAMFVTEREGGSDVGAVETTARFDGSHWLLNGSKWFCSNVDSQAIVLPARPEGAPAGVRGLALFLLPKHRVDGSPNGIHIRRIKDKLGTRAVPTGEVDLLDAEARLLAGPGRDAYDGRGIHRLMEMVNESRLGVATMGSGIMRRAFLEAAIYASERKAFGKRLDEHGMIREELIRMLVETEAAAALIFKSASLLDGGWDEAQTRNPLVRILVALAKIRGSRRGIELASAALEMFGGNGYVEDWPLARQLRDAQCHTVWEGTENVVALDVLRSMGKEQTHEAALAFVGEAIDAASDDLLRRPRRAVQQGTSQLRQALRWLAEASPETVQLRARRLANFFADVVQGALLLDEAAWELREHGRARKAVIADWFAREHLAPDPCRGIPRFEPAVFDLFPPLIGYGEIKPSQAASCLT